MTRRRGFGLYVHWPFCQTKCPYCDFNSHVSSDINQADWQGAFRSEIERTSLDLPHRTLDSIFFGGGTPSLMRPETVDAVISAARATWPFSNEIEVTLEANPTSVEAQSFAGFADAGVNRVSIGVQALNDPDLRRLGRLHTADEARSAVEIARSSFPRMSFDLIYARQDQGLKTWESELAEAIAMAGHHLSLYQLTIEPGTVFGERFSKGKLPGLPEEDLAADMFALTQEMTESAGLPAYEISNHAPVGEESRHNLIYWRGHDWIGIGPGAHGRFTKDGQRVATESYLSPSGWLSAVQAGNGESKREVLTQLDDTEERLMMGLRLSEGIEEAEFPEYLNKFNKLIEIGMLERNARQLRATSAGRPVLNSIVRSLLA